MTAAGAAGVAFALFVVLLGVRVVLSEAVWPSYRIDTRPRRVVRALDALAAGVLFVLAVALATVVGPALLAR